MLAARRLPTFGVPDGNGEGVPAGWWQRRELLVALVHAGCPECAELRARLGSRRAALRARGALDATLELDGRGAGSELAGRIARSLGLEPGAAYVVVADRFGEVFASLPVHGGKPGAVLDEAEAWIDHIQQQCPE